jgi:transketolase
MQNSELLSSLAKRLRVHILQSTTQAGSGHLTSSLSAVELMTVLMFGGYFRYFIDNPQHPNNDRLIFSKGHASPLFYSLWAAAGAFPAEELLTLREFGSRLEGHPTMAFPYTEVPTGSLGQGLSIGLGMALNAQYLDKLPYKTYVLLGDSELAEGSNWEAMEVAAHYKLQNLVGILDVNRLGQRGETMLGHDIENYRLKVEAFGWETTVVDGHDMRQIDEAYQKAQKATKPFMIIAKTLKGKGFPMVEDKDNWHGKAVSKEDSEKLLLEFGPVDMTVVGKIVQPERLEPHKDMEARAIEVDESYIGPLSTRKAYGHALVEMFPQHPDMVVLDAETSNSTFSDAFMKAHPDKFFEMFIAEQNMVGVAVGLALRGKMPFVSTFAAFLSRAFDQLRTAQYSGAHINVAGSHAGVSIGEDGATQMGLEDIAMFRTFLNSTVLYPADHVCTEK